MGQPSRPPLGNPEQSLIAAEIGDAWNRSDPDSVLLGGCGGPGRVRPAGSPVQRLSH